MEIGRFNMATIKLIYINEVACKERATIKTPTDAYQVFYDLWDKETIGFFEEVKAVYLDNQNRVIGVYHINQGANNASVVDVKRLFAAAILSNCVSIVVAHNHPSNRIYPSEQDRELTKAMLEICKLFNLYLLDHIIVCPEYDTYFSFANDGW